MKSFNKNLGKDLLNTFKLKAGGTVKYAVSLFSVMTFASFGAHAQTAPVVYDFNLVGVEDVEFTPTFQLTSGAPYYDADGDPIVAVKISATPLHGELRVNGSLISAGAVLPVGVMDNMEYYPNPNYNGPDSFGFNCFDGTSFADNDATFFINISAVNDAPTAISFTSLNVDENLPAGTTVGFLSAIDVDDNDTHTYALVSGAGDNDNAHFAIVANKLQSATGFNYESRYQYAIRLATTDAEGETYEVPVLISVNDANDAPNATDFIVAVVSGNTYSFTAAQFEQAFTDEDGSALTQVKITELPAVGTLLNAGVPVMSGDELTLNELDNLTYESVASYSGVPTFKWAGLDGALYSAEAVTRIKVGEVRGTGGHTGSGTMTGTSLAGSGFTRPISLNGGGTVVSGSGIFNASGSLRPSGGTSASTNAKLSGEELLQGDVTIAGVTLHSAYPNPFTNDATISYELPVDGYVEVKLFNSIGMEIKTLVSENQAAGKYTSVWNGRSESENNVSAGNYMYMITVKDAAGNQVNVTSGKILKM